MKFAGVFTAIITPMDGGAVDVESLRGLVRHQLDGGVSGLVVCGSTGEGATLTDGEQGHALAVVIDEVLGRKPVVAGIGARSTHGAIAQAQAAKEAGADGLLVVTPAYNKPTQAGLEAHFLAVADATDLPVCLYNVPGRTSVDLLPETTGRLARHEGIVALKDATGSLPRAAAIRALVGEDFSLLSGDDPTLLPFMAQGGDGCISVLSNVAPAEVVKLVDSVGWRNLADARKIAAALGPLVSALFVESNPIPAKTALAWMGIIGSAELRLPLVPLTEAGGDVLAAGLEAAGISFRRAPGAPSTLGPGFVPERGTTTGSFRPLAP
jgi:4-hydroxy-tetrahydrodipicolinate synthase